MEIKRSNGDEPPSEPRPRPFCGAVGKGYIHVFMPQPGITADELAKSVELVAIGIGVLMRAIDPSACDMVYAEMDEGTRRHWRVHELPNVVTAKQQPPKLHLPPGMNYRQLPGSE